MGWTRFAVRAAAIAGFTGSLMVGSAPVRVQASAPPERFTALAVNMFPHWSAPIEIVIDRWSSEVDRDQFFNMVLDRGPDRLLEAIARIPSVGYFRAPGLPLNALYVGDRSRLQFAQRTPLPEGGEQIVGVTDRPLGFGEVFGERSRQYPFRVIFLTVNKDGEGEGQLSLATKITGDSDTGDIGFETYGSEPMQLTGVKRHR